MKNLKALVCLLAIGAGAALCAEACTRLGGAATRADFERTVTR